MYVSSTNCARPSPRWSACGAPKAPKIVSVLRSRVVRAALKAIEASGVCLVKAGATIPSQRNTMPFGQVRGLLVAITKQPVLILAILPIVTDVSWAHTAFDVRMIITQTNFPQFSERFTNSSAALSRSIKRASWTARCIVDGSNWQIESHFSPNAIDSYSYDGTNVLHQTKIVQRIALPDAMPIRLLEQPEGDPNIDTNDWVFLTITPGMQPLDNLGGNLPWLVFCSGPFFKYSDSAVPLPGADVRHVAGAFGFEHEVRTFPDDLGLPAACDFIASAELLEKAAVHDSLLRDGRTAADNKAALRPLVGFADGFVVGSYRVLNRTNLEGCSLPTLFTYEQFRTGFDERANLALYLRGEILSIETTQSSSPLLSNTQLYSVVDYRFRSKRGVVDDLHYGITNGVVPTINDPALQKLFAARVAVAPLDPVFKAHYGMYGVLAALLAGPVLIVLIIRYLTRHSRNNT